MAGKLKSDAEKEDELREAFKVFDKEGTGKIRDQDLKLVMQSLGESMTDEEVQEMLNEADENGDGVIDYEGKNP